MKKILSIILSVVSFMSLYTFNGYADQEEQFLNDTQQQAFFILKDLGFLDGDYDEEMVVETGNVTRGLFSEFVENVYNTSGVVTDELYFHDVPRTYFAFEPIAYLASRGMISVSDDKLFYPDRFITKPEAAKIIICALGYGNLCNEGVWPANVNAVAEKFDLYDGVKSTAEISYADMLVMVKNSLTVEVLTPDGTGNFGGVEYKNEGETFLSKYYDIYVGEGRLEGFDGVGVFGGNVEKNRALIDGVEYTTRETADFTNLLGKEVEYYYRSNKDVDEIILMMDTEDTEELILYRKDNDMTFDEKTFSVSYTNENNRKKTVDVAKNVSVVYNDVYLENSVAEVLSGDLYQMTLLKTEGNEYDVIIAKNYENYIFENADPSTEKVYLTACDTALEIKQKVLDLNEYKDVEIIMPDGSKGLPEQITSGAVLSVFESKNKEKIRIVVSYNEILSEIKSVSEDEFFTVSDNFGEYFAYNQGMYWETELGSNVVLKLDFAGYIASIERGDSKYNFGYFTNVFINEDDDTYSLRFFANDGEMKIIPFAERVTVDNTLYTDNEEVYRIFKSINPELMVYELDAKGNIKTIDIAAEKGSAIEEGDMLIKITDGYESCLYMAASKKMGRKFRVGTQTAVMSVSSNPADREKDKFFSVGSNTNFSNDNNYTVCAYSYGTELKEFADAVLTRDRRMNSEVWISTNVLVDEVTKTVNKNDEVVYKITGWHGENYRELMCSEEFSKNFPKLQRGDVINVSNFSNEEVGGFTIMSGPNAEGRRVDTTTNTVKHTMFYIHDVVGTTVYGGYHSGETWDEVITPGSLTVFIYDAKTKEITKGNTKDIITYKMAGDKCDDVYVYLRYDSDRNFVVYRNMK